MKQSTTILLLLGILIIAGTMAGYKVILKYFLPHWEGFSSRPYWDFKQWSWGYGTRVPNSVNDPTKKPAGTITRPQAFDAMMEHIERDYNDLKKLITVPLSATQWAALLSFSYNLGVGNADNLVHNINSQDLAALGVQWNAYVNAGGVPQDVLIRRRAAEWELFAKL
jgi:lysozyme